MPMKLLKLEIEGFRSLRHVVWEPGNLNILIGPNAGGKSNLLKVLKFCSVAAAGELYEHVFRKEGGMSAIVWDGEATTIKSSLTIGPCRLPDSNQDCTLQYVTMIDRNGESNSYHFRREWLYLGYGASPPSDVNPLLDRFGDKAVLYNPVANPTDFFESGRYKTEESALSLAAHPIAPSPVARDVAEWLARWAIHPGFQTTAGSDLRRPSIARSERRLEPDGQNLINVLHTLYTNDPDFEQDVADAMHAAFGDEFVKLVFTPDAGDQRIQLKVRWKSLKRQASAAELSDGTLRFLYLLAILANPDLPPFIAIDEPEAGLHPAMLPIIASYAADAAERTQLLFTTHSPEFLDAFSEVDVQPTTSVVECRDGQTEIKTIEGEQLTFWLKEYKLGELYRTKTLETMP